MSDLGVAKRPEFERPLAPVSAEVVVERPLPLWERAWNQAALRRAVLLLLLGFFWETYARWLGNPLLFPACSETIAAAAEAFASGVLIHRTLTTLEVLTVGYCTGLAIAAVFTTFAVSTRIGTDLLTTLTAMFNPLPAIALLPLALIWFGLGRPSLVFVIVHSVLWAVALNTLMGFRAVPETLRMAGRNFGLSGIRYVALLLVPAAFPAILAGLKIGWAFAWRTLIAAELVFGASARQGGLGWHIFEARAQLDTAGVFAGLLVIIVIGLVVESVVFRLLEVRTVNRWGLQR